jgi:ectoine hydroxylase-related dioxygenase (phytanoyl-CoA dioxygenase family)
MGFMTLSQEELSSEQLAPETLEQAANQVKLNGFVVLENAVPVDLVDDVNQDLLNVIDRLLKTDAERTEVNTSPFRKNRIRMDLPFRDPFIDPWIITNAFAMPILERILGEDCRMFYFSVDAPMPGSDYQTVHGDYTPFYPESDLIMPITGLVVNYPLVNVTEENGPLEVWPNTHLTPEKFYTGNQVQEAAKYLDPVRMLTPKGSLIIRDVRMWHRGTPNVSSEIRPNMALIYGRNWWDGAFYPQESLGITQHIHTGLSERAKKLFRFETLVP